MKISDQLIAKLKELKEDNSISSYSDIKLGINDTIKKARRNCFRQKTTFLRLSLSLLEIRSPRDFMIYEDKN